MVNSYMGSSDMGMTKYPKVQTPDYAPEYTDENMQKQIQSLSSLLAPQYQRAMAQVGNQFGGYGGSALLGKGGAVQSQMMGQLGQYGMNLLDTAQNARRQERLLGEERSYENPFREAALTGQYGGQYTTQMLPYLLSGNLSPNQTGADRWSGLQTDRQLDPAWQSAQKAGFANPLEKSEWITDPTKFSNMYGGYDTKQQQTLGQAPQQVQAMFKQWQDMEKGDFPGKAQVRQQMWDQMVKMGYDPSTFASGQSSGSYAYNPTSGNFNPYQPDKTVRAMGGY